MIELYLQIHVGEDGLLIILWEHMIILLELFEIFEYSNVKSVPVGVKMCMRKQIF